MGVLYPENHKKYTGYIKCYKNHYEFIYVKLKKNIYVSKHTFIDEKTKIEAYNNTIERKKQYSINNNLKIINLYREYENKYYYININNNKDDINNKIEMLIDKEDLYLVNRFNWTVKNSNYHPTAYVKKNKDISDIKNKLLKNNEKYDFDLINKYNFISFIKLKFGTSIKNISFRNKNRYDYRSENIHITDKNIFFIKNINKKILKSLPDKVNNLYIIKGNNDIFWEVRAKKEDEIINRRFSFNNLGRLISKNRAMNFSQKLLDNNFKLL